MSKRKIYVFCNGTKDVLGQFGQYATILLFDVITDDGVFLSQESFGSIPDALSATGVTSESSERHDMYRRYFPEGYEVEYVVPPDDHEGFQRAMNAHRQMSLDEYERRLAKAQDA